MGLLHSVMVDFSQQFGYTVDEIRVKFADRRLPDWDSPPHGPFMGETVTWQQWREAFPPPEQEEFTLGSGRFLAPLGGEPVLEHDPSVWTPCIFDAHTLPAAAYLDPEGWTEIMEIRSRNSKHWRRFCPNTYAVATALFGGLIQHDLWGQHHGKGQWKTMTAGKKPKERKPAEALAEAARGDAGAGGLGQENGSRRKRTWPDKRMALIDVLNSLGHPDRYALGSTDARLNIYEREDIWRHPFFETCVNRLRIDVDMERAWGRSAIFNQDQGEVADEISRETALIKSLGMTPHFFKTGGRGHQIVIPTPTLDRSVASLLVLMIRYLLADGRTPRKKPRYKVLEVDKSNVECLMRLPLGRHAETKAVAWMIDADTANVLPPELQAEAVASAWNYGGLGCELLEQSREALGLGLDAMHHDRDMSVCASAANAERFQALEEIVGGLPDCPTLSAFHATCDAWRIPSLRRAPMGTVPTGSQQQHHYICGAVSPEGSLAVPQALSEQVEREKQADTLGPRVKLGKGWAHQVLDEGFEPGGFFEWSHSSGRNGIGAAILFCDGDRDRAEELLIRMARQVDCRSEEERQKRIDWIGWAVPRNNINLHYERPELNQHRNLHGVVMDEETDLALRVVEELVRRRRESELPRKVFAVKSLTTLRHITELVQMEARSSADEFVRVSVRTLAAEIAARWPEDATDGKDVSRQMEWITRKLPRRIRRIAMVQTSASDKNKCLFCVLEQLPTSRRAFDAKGYVLGNDFIAMLPVGK